MQLGKGARSKGHNAYFRLYQLGRPRHDPAAWAAKDVTHWQIEADANAVADAACRAVGAAAREAIQAHGSFALVLAGGGTPLDTYRRLAASDQDWERWVLFYGDERCLPAADEQRNSWMVEQTGLPANVGKHHPIPAEFGPRAASAAYRKLIKASSPFDMVLLGVGEDGHTASLFPGQQWPDESVFAVHDAPKPPPERVTLSIAALQNCSQMLVLAAGKNKADAIRRWRSGEDLPAAQASDIDQATILVDRAGMGIVSDKKDSATVDVQ